MSPLLPRSGKRSDFRQRGAIGVLAAVALSAAMAAALLAVDVGSQTYTRRHLQTVADTAALSAVKDIPNAQSIAIDNASRNGFTVPGTRANTLATAALQYDYDNHAFVTGGTDFNAVQVTVTTQQPYFFMLGSRLVTATAIAARSDVAGISVGAGLASIDTSQSPLLDALLGKLLNTSIKLDVMSYQGLVNTDVRLLDLVKAKGSVGTVRGLLDLDLTVSELLELTATALTQSDVADVDVKVLDALHLLALRVDGGLHLKLSDLLDVSLASDGAAADARINVFQLINLAAQVANGKHFLDIPVVGLDLGGLAKLNIALSLIAPPSRAIGPPGMDSSGNWRTQAHNAQWRLKIDLDVLGALSGVEGSGLVHLPLYLEIAAANAQLKSIDCKDPRDSSVVTVGANSSLVRAYVGDVNADAMTNVHKPAKVKRATIVNVLGLITVDAEAAINLPGGGDGGGLEFNGPFDEKNTQRISGLSTAGLFGSLGSDMVLDVKLLGIEIKLGELVKALSALLAPIFGLLDSLLAPVLSLLGIQLGYADVTTFYLKCGARELIF
ncbi:MAG: pilus assembly protein TadG-related protein [Sulfuricella sp.]|nr:pilus assembly protein TadG-related protein [Sulfuricella sp.]